MALATTEGKETALKALAERRANKPGQINNSELPAGAPMHFYCVSCGHKSDVLPEGYTCTPSKLCGECAALKKLGWLE